MSGTRHRITLSVLAAGRTGHGRPSASLLDDLIQKGLRIRLAVMQRGDFIATA
jgi:hypothetical protein